MCILHLELVVHFGLVALLLDKLLLSPAQQLAHLREVLRQVPRRAALIVLLMRIRVVPAITLITKFEKIEGPCASINCLVVHFIILSRAVEEKFQ